MVDVMEIANIVDKSKEFKVTDIIESFDYDIEEYIEVESKKEKIIVGYLAIENSTMKLKCEIYLKKHDTMACFAFLKFCKKVLGIENMNISFIDA